MKNYRCSYFNSDLSSKANAVLISSGPVASFFRLPKGIKDHDVSEGDHSASLHQDALLSAVSIQRTNTYLTLSTNM